ncbi:MULTISPECIES: helix-turn-helix domain-containing protein [unclassified Streptomyces]|uniref:helix-turn-helix domain-containing protein n=1 Tax=unclassified Streptomyces TaxID=2593676 RepID=UPI0019D2D30F
MVHETTRHTRDFTVIGNRLLQHPDIGGVAIAVGCHMMSVAEGTSVTIRCLADRLGFSRQKVADALHALERHGYLRRTVIRTAKGRLITQTVICHNPGSSTPTRPRPKPQRPPTAPDRNENRSGAPNPVSKPEPQPEPAPRPKPGPRPLPPVPRPGFPAKELLDSALRVLLGLQRTDPRLYVSEADAQHLTPGVAAWLERGTSPEVVHHALTYDLPKEPLRRPAALLAHRLTAHLPPAPQLGSVSTPAAPPPPPAPLMYCETCDTCFRSQPATPCPTCGSRDTVPSVYTPGNRRQSSAIDHKQRA